MASVNLAFVLSVTSLLLLLLSDAADLPSTADESTAGDANPTQVLDSRLENTVTADLPVVVDGIDRVGLSLRRPFHRRRSHCHHGHHRFRGREVVPFGEHGEWSSASTAAEEAMNWATVTKKDGRWHIMNKEHKKKRRAEEDGSDSDSDSDDEGMDYKKKELRKEKGGWAKWFWALWD